MKIAFFTESLPPNIDGVSHTLHYLTKTLISSGVEFVFYSPVKPGPAIPWHDRVRKVASFPLPLYKYYLIGLPLSSGIQKELDEFSPDLIHLVSPTFLGAYGLNYSRKRRIPVVSSYHTHFVSYFRYYGISLLENAGWRFLKWFHNQCAVNYAPSPNAAEELNTHGIKRVELWQRGIDTEKFSPSFRDPSLRQSIGAGNTPILLFVGRLVKEKDLDDLVMANNILKKRGNRYKLVIVGDGPMRQNLISRLPEAHFTGFISEELLSRWYASSDVFVFPSTTETFGNVIQEALASAIPAIGVRKGGVQDLIENGETGLLAQPNSPNEFAMCIETLLKDVPGRLSMGLRAQKRASQNSWEAINGRLLASYERVLKAHRDGNGITTNG